MSASMSDWDDLLRAAQVAITEFDSLQARGLLDQIGLLRGLERLTVLREEWHANQLLGAAVPSDTGLSPRLKCRQCERPATSTQNFCATCGGPTGQHADALRYLDFSIHLFETSVAPELQPAMAERCGLALRDRVTQLELTLKDNRSPEVAEALEPPKLKQTSSHPSRRNLFDLLLDPRVIRWLLGSGGGLLVVGLVIYLSSLGVFKNALVVASAIGAGTLALVAGGIALVQFTRHTLPGRALALLGCLVMPLNLWFYHANNLITLDGHLWLAATVCCLLYAAVAVVLKDHLFIYVLFGGIAMTGMLALADVHRLIEISAPATLLIGLGLVSLHAERAFADDDGPFSRKRFGMACFWSAQALIGLGLTLLLGFQIASYLPNYGWGMDHFAALKSNQYLMLGLVLAGGYAFGYSALVVRQRAIYGQLAVVCLLWAEILGIQIGHLIRHMPVLLTVLSLTSLAMNTGFWLLAKRGNGRHAVLAEPLAPLGIGLMAIVLIVSLAQRLPLSLMSGEALTTTWASAGALVLAALVSRAAAMMHSKVRPRLSGSYLIATAAATFLGVDSLLRLAGVTAWPAESVALMALPMLYLVAARFHQSGPAKQLLPTIASVMAIGLTLSSLLMSFGQWVTPLGGSDQSLWLAGFALEAAAFFTVAAFMRGGAFNVYFAAAMVCGLVYQVGGFARVPVEANYFAIAAAGVFGLVGYRLMGRDVRDKSPTARALFLAANALVSLPMASVMLMSLSRLALRQMNFTMLWMPAALSLVALVAAVVSGRGTRRWYASLTIAQIVLALLALGQYSTLSLPRKAEVFSVVIGLLMLIVGNVLWFRTQDNDDDRVALSLFIGALAAGLPPAIFAITNRFAYTVSLADELTLLTVALLMFLTGTITRLRTTQVIGGGLLGCHLLMLIVFAGMQAQLALGAYVAIGGAVLFGTGLLLSMNRERLYRLKHVDLIRCTC